MDARHHPFDVLFGSAMGILVAWGSYRQYFPAVGNTWLKGRAHPIRTWGKEKNAPTEPQGIAMEPLRSPTRLSADRLDEGQQRQGAGGNVFREQVSRSRRQRHPAPDHEVSDVDVHSLNRQRDHERSELSSSDEEQHFQDGIRYERPVHQAPLEQRTLV